MKPQDVRRVIVDTTVEPKNVIFPTDAILTDAGYNGHNAPLSHRFRVFTSGATSAR